MKTKAEKTKNVWNFETRSTNFMHLPDSTLYARQFCLIYLKQKIKIKSRKKEKKIRNL